MVKVFLFILFSSLFYSAAPGRAPESKIAAPAAAETVMNSRRESVFCDILADVFFPAAEADCCVFFSLFCPFGFLFSLNYEIQKT
jgi:hypothetical protein